LYGQPKFNGNKDVNEDKNKNRREDNLDREKDKTRFENKD